MNETEARRMLYRFMSICHQHKMQREGAKNFMKNMDQLFADNPDFVNFTKEYGFKPSELIEANNLVPEAAEHIIAWRWGGGKYGKKHGDGK